MSLSKQDGPKGTHEEVATKQHEEKLLDEKYKGSRDIKEHHVEDAKRDTTNI